MKSRLSVLLILLVVALVAAFFSPATRRLVLPVAAVEQDKISTTPVESSPFHDQDTTFVALRDRLLEGYRLRPDARYLGAISEIARMTGRTAAAPLARFSGGAWRVTCGADTVAELSEFPEFTELEESLTRWAQTCAPTPVANATSGADDVAWQRPLVGLDPISALRVIDERWKRGERNASLLLGATRALTLLTMQSPDLVGTATPIASRALASLAMCRATSGAAPEREACLLADVMGYTAEARDRAARLPAGDAVRLYVNHDDVGLELGARGDDASDEARYLYLTRLCHGTSFARWSKFYEKAFGHSSSRAAAALSTALTIRDFDAQIPASGAVLAALKDELETRGFQRPNPLVGLIGNRLSALINEFERVIATPPPTPDGTFLDSRLLIAHERSLFYSALWVYGDHMMYSLSSIDGTTWFAQQMGSPVAGPGRDFQERFSHLADAKAGERKPTNLEHDLATPSVFGGRLDRSTLAALSPLLTRAGPDASVPIRNFAARLDTRPVAREQLAWALRDLVQVPTQSEDLFTSAARACGADDARLLAWQAHLARDPDSLSRLLQRADFDTDEWARVLSIAGADSTLPSTVVDRAFERAVTLHPTDWSLAVAWSSRLSEQKRYPKAREVVAYWLSLQQEDINTFEELFAHIRIARSYREEGNLADGLREMGTFDESYQFGTMNEKALLLAALGRDAEAESLAVHALGRYPDLADARALLMRVLWKGGRYQESAALLQASPWSVLTAKWSEALTPAFRATFAGKPDKAILAAQALAAGGPGGRARARDIAADFERRGELPVAFEIWSHIPSGGGERVTDAMAVYRILKKQKGESEALAWLNAHVSQELRLFSYELAWGSGLPELVWNYVPLSLPGVEDDYEWLLRAATVAMGDRDPGHVRAVEERLASNGRGTYYVDIARCMMGALSEAELLSRMRAPKQRCETYYFMGLKAESEGRERDAADWYAMSVATGLHHNGELRWSVDRLLNCVNRERQMRPGPSASASVATQGARLPRHSS